MVPPFLLFSILISLHLICQGEEIESPKIAGPKYAIIKGDFTPSVFEKKLGQNLVGHKAWGYQSLMEDNRDKDGYCGYCKNEEYKDALFCDFRCNDPIFGVYGNSFFLEYNKNHNGEALFYHISTGSFGAGRGCCDHVDITPVPGTVKLMSSKPLLSDYIGTYTITKQLYNGFQQYEAYDEARIYVNIYNQWVIGTADHTDILIMGQVEATPYFESVQPDWTMSMEHVNEEDTIITLRTETDLTKSSGQPPECIIEGNYYLFRNHEDKLFKLTPEGTYTIQGSENCTRYDDNARYFNRSSHGWWTQYRNTEWIKEDMEGKLYFNPEEFRTSESSTVIPGLGWGERGRKDFQPNYDISIVGSPCTIALKSDPMNNAAVGTYNIEEELVNDHPAYIRNDKFSVYVNPSKKWVFGQIKNNPSTQEKEREDILVLSQDITKTPLTWPKPWTNQGTQQNPVLTYQEN